MLRPVGFECKSSIGLGEIQTPLLEGAYRVSHALESSTKQDSHRSLGLDLPVGRGGSAVEAEVD